MGEADIEEIGAAMKTQGKGNPKDESGKNVTMRVKT